MTSEKSRRVLPFSAHSQTTAWRQPSSSSANSLRRSSSRLRSNDTATRSKTNRIQDSLFGPDDVTRTLSARYYKDGSEILVAQLPSKEKGPKLGDILLPPDEVDAKYKGK